MPKMIFLICFILLFIPRFAISQADIDILAGKMVEDGLQTNEKIVEFLQSHQCEVGLIDNCDRPLSVKDIEILKSLFRDLESWKKETFDYIVPETDQLKGRKFKLIQGPHSVEFKRSVLHISLDPRHQDSHHFYMSMNIAVSLNLVMYDSFFKLSQVLSKAKKIRSILQYDMGPEGKILNETFSVALSDKVWNRLQAGMSLLQEASRFMSQKKNIFEQYIENSFTAERIREKDFAHRMRSVMFLNRILSQSEFIEVIERITFRLSRFFGNTAGKIQLRDGKLKKFAKKPQVMNSIKNKLRPLNILLEKTPFRLTDKFIPGFYGHVAIWLGRPEELMDMRVTYKGNEISLLDHPKMRPYLERMSLGKLVIEALREPGVTMNTLEHFMDIDDLLVLAPLEGTNPGELVLRAIEQIGKPYDFNFDVETEREIICSELIYTVFNDREWPIEQTLGRYTISPDHVAWKVTDSCLKPILMYHDGAEVTGNMTGKLKELLGRKGGISYTPRGHCF